MRKRRKNQKREKIIMLCGSAFVLTALTMTGIYVKEQTERSSDGYMVDLSQLEHTQEEAPEDSQPAPDTRSVTSSKVENPEPAIPQEEEDAYVWAFEETFEEEFAAVEEEELSFSEEEQLLWPVVGNVLINYSMGKPVYFATLEQYKYNPAIMIQAEEGQNISAAADGRVTKIVKEEQLGTVVTMDLGSGYEISYGQLTNIQFKEGDRVNKGEYIGDVAAPTKYFSVEGCNVYFALKKEGKPINPLTKLD